VPQGELKESKKKRKENLNTSDKPFEDLNMGNEKNLEVASNNIKRELLRVVREELQRLDLETSILNELKTAIKEILEKKLTAAINEIDFPLLLKTALREILEPLIVKSIEEVIGDRLFILKLIDKSRKSNELKTLR